MSRLNFNQTFPHNWSAEILPSRPLILPNLHFIYPQAADEVEKGALELLIHPNGAPTFLATCALGFRDPAAPTGVWSTPNPDWLCAVAGGYAYLIDTTQPDRFTMVHFRPVLQVFCYLSVRASKLSNQPASESNAQQSKSDETASLQNSLLLFAGHHAILAWGRNGQLWESDRLSSEGLTNLRIDGQTLLGDGWDLISDRETPFALDLLTGQRS